MTPTSRVHNRIVPAELRTGSCSILPVAKIRNVVITEALATEKRTKQPFHTQASLRGLLTTH